MAIPRLDDSRARATLTSPARTTLLALALAIAGCGGTGSSSWAADRKGAGPGGPEQSALKVAVTRLQPRALERTYATSGTLRAVRAADLVAPSAAIIQDLLVEEGDRVKAGQVLAKLDGRAAGLQAAQARVQLGNLERELERLQSAQPGVISKEEIDKQRYLVEEARASLELSKHQVGLTSVRAPFAGTITARRVEVGALASAQTPLFSLADLDVLELDLYLPEVDAATVKLDAEVDVELVDGSHFVGKVVRRAPIVDAATGTVKFTIRSREFPSNAAPGAFARAKVMVDARAAAPSVPRSAVFEVEGKPHVYVIEDGKAHRKPITLGLLGESFAEITSGIAADDVVVTDGSAGITEGMPLAAADAPPEAEAAPATAAAPSKDAKAGNG